MRGKQIEWACLEPDGSVPQSGGPPVRPPTKKIDLEPSHIVRVLAYSHGGKAVNFIHANYKRLGWPSRSHKKGNPISANYHQLALSRTAPGVITVRPGNLAECCYSGVAIETGLDLSPIGGRLTSVGGPGVYGRRWPAASR